MRLVKDNSILSVIYHFIVYYPAPSNITYMWNFGLLAGICLVIQLITGIALAMHYVPNVMLAFDSVEHIMRDVNYGWILRYLHANGASMFFIVVYIHIFRGIYYGSYMTPRQHLWNSGVAILFVMIVTAFIGYVLPWGQMSFWGATVITNLVSAVPVIGQEIVYWLWGGFSVDNATLNKFFSLHYILPFVIVGLMLIHLILLHENGSTNPLGITTNVDTVAFTPYLTLKDTISLIIFLLFFNIFVCFMPNLLGHPDNYIPANPMVTPPHIVPEWYFLPFYAILRAIPDKLGGVIAMIASILCLLFIAIVGEGNTRTAMFRPLYKQCFWIFLIVCLLLGWVGGNPVKYPYYELSQLCTVVYFLFILGILPFIVQIEKVFWEYANRN